MSDPWIPASGGGTSRWLEYGSTVAFAGASSGRAGVIGMLIQAQRVTGISSGRASASGDLSVAQVAQGSSAGSSSASGWLGSPVLASGASAGQASVSGDLHQGTPLILEGASRGTSYAGVPPYPRGGLQVKKYTEISGEQTGDYGGASGDLPPMGGDRGLTRGHFTPRSVGRTSSKRPGS